MGEIKGRVIRCSWEVVRGHFDDVVSCESSSSSYDDDDDDDDDAVDVDHKVDPHPHPLLLRRPTPLSASQSESPPCEITVVFAQLHDIKQVYVRSTARVYEIYSAPTTHNADNDYLCTVRCGIADAGSSSSTNTDADADADGWVDVKLNNSSTLAIPIPIPDTSSNTHQISIIKDRFEATAEISDGDPVMSITLRLLSIQSGDYICIDEVYVFADPVELPDNHCPPPALEASPGGAMLSMFIPTLLQLSKPRMSNVQQNTGFTTARETSINRDTEQHSTDALDTSNIVRTQVLPNMVNNDAFLHQPNNHYQTQNSQNKPHITNTENDLTSSRIQQTLDELVSRVSRIEAFCLRFEENMLKPIINMETRLERVEHQLETFTKNSHFQRTGCTRYSAPDFSCIESESDSVCTGGNGNPATLKSESRKKDDCCCPQELRAPSSDVCLQLSTSASQLLPGLIISAPEFSSMDEEEETNSMEEVKDSPKILKKPMSIDNALASALAGFVTSALTKSSEHTVAVEEAEIVLEAEMSGSSCLSASSTALARQLECTKMIEEAENFSALVHSDEHQLSLAPIDGGDTSSKDPMVAEKANLADISGGEETTKTVYGNNHVLFEGGNELPHSSAVDTSGETESESSITGIKCTESDHDAGQAYVTDICDSGIDSTILKDAESYSEEGIFNARSAVLQDIIELPTPAKVDFSVTLLDVSFSPLTSSSGKSSLESLLVDIPDLECEAPPVREDVASSLSEQYDLVVIEDKSGGCDTADNMLLYVDDCDTVYAVDDSDSSNRNNQDVCGTSSLI